MESNSVEQHLLADLTDDMKTVVHEAWSIENKAAWANAGQEDTFLFEKTGKDGRISQFYKDENGNYWFRNIWKRKDGTIISEEEHIFGQSRPRSLRHR